MAQQSIPQGRSKQALDDESSERRLTGRFCDASKGCDARSFNNNERCRTGRKLALNRDTPLSGQLHLKKLPGRKSIHVISECL